MCTGPLSLSLSLWLLSATVLLLAHFLFLSLSLSRPLYAPPISGGLRAKVEALCLDVWEVFMEHFCFPPL